MKKRKISSSNMLASNTPSPSKRAVTRHIHTPIEQDGTIEYSSDSSADGIAICKIEDLLLSVRETTNNKLIILVSNSRPETHLGKKQGDHVSAFISFIEMLVAASEDKSAKKVATYFADIAKAVIPEKGDIFDEISARFQAKAELRFSREERKVLTGKLSVLDTFQVKVEKLQTSLKDAERMLNRDIIQEMGEAFLKQLNAEKTIAFKKSGDADKAEGVRVKKAAHALKAINELKAIINDVAVPDSVLAFFYHDYIKIGAKYKDGLNAVVGDDKGYTVNRALKEWITTVTPQRDILEELYGNVTPKKIARFFGDLFDFDWSKHKTDNIELLYEVTARHLVIMFHAFDELQKYDSASREVIIDVFLRDTVLDRCGWIAHEDGLSLRSLKDELERHATLKSERIIMKRQTPLSLIIEQQSSRMMT